MRARRPKRISSYCGVTPGAHDDQRHENVTIRSLPSFRVMKRGECRNSLPVAATSNQGHRLGNDDRFRVLARARANGSSQLVRLYGENRFTPDTIGRVGVWTRSEPPADSLVVDGGLEVGQQRRFRNSRASPALWRFSAKTAIPPGPNGSTIYDVSRATTAKSNTLTCAPTNIPIQKRCPQQSAPSATCALSRNAFACGSQMST